MNECESPNAEEHRENMAGYDDDEVISELYRAWGSYLPDDPLLKANEWNTPEYILQDWSCFRAITTREARRRGLKIPSDLRKIMGKWGVVL